ncbi:MAG: MliC family protein [Fusobacteriota bacterium]
MFEDMKQSLTLDDTNAIQELKGEENIMIKKYNKIIIVLMLFILLGSISVQAKHQSNNLNEEYSTFITKDLLFGVQFENDYEKLKLILPDGNINILSQEKSESGAKYSNDKVHFWKKKNKVQIYFDDIYFKMEVIDIKADKLKKYFDFNNEKINKEKELIVFKSKGFYILLKDMGDEGQVIFPNHESILTRERTASGVKYSNDGISVWNKGEELLIELGGFEFKAHLIEVNDYINEQKYIFKALGQEPGWQMKIKEEEIQLFMDYGNIELNIYPHQISMEILNENIIYNITTALFDFQINIIKSIHTDIMSGQKYPYSVKITSKNKCLIGGGYIN